MTHTSPKLSRKKILLGAVVIVVLIGLAYYSVFHYAETPQNVLQYFRRAQRIEFCTIKPDAAGNELPEDFGYGDIEGYSIVDRVFLKKQAAVISAITRSDRMNNSTAAGCFNPRHAIRDSEDEENYLLICFECLQMRYSFEGETGTALISRAQLPFFQKLVELHSMTRAVDLRKD